MAAKLLFSLILLSILSSSSPLPSQTILNAAQVLSDSGFVSMSLILPLLSDSLISSSQSATLFSPSDSAFSRSGQPPLSVLQFHASPLTFSPDSLRSLPAGTKIPTMYAGHSLVVTTSAASGQSSSLNNLTVNESPIYNDGSLIIFGVDGFFNPEFNVSAVTPNPSSDSGCRSTSNSPQSAAHSFDLGALRSRGYSSMASFLDLQLPGFQNDTRWTILAPMDGVMEDRVGNLSDLPSLLRRHVLPCKLQWTDFSNFNSSTTLTTSLEGFTISVTSSDGIVMLNGVVLASPELYNSDSIVVHGLRQVLELTNGADERATLEDGGSHSEDREEF